MDKLDLVNAFLSADFHTGTLSWRADAPDTAFPSERLKLRYASKYAGELVKVYRINKFGHLSAQVRHHGGSVNILAHRAVWALARGGFPSFDVDHINNDPTDNRLVNLRPATRSQNATNGRRVKAGLKGAYRNKQNGSWFSTVWDGKRLSHLGTFDSAELAHDAWVRAKAHAAGKFFNPGYASVFD